jgi:uncharacterized damage-inducible protein DinB
MPWTDQYRALSRYNVWMNERLYQVALSLTDVARKRDRGAFFGSIHGTLNHLLLGDSVWMRRFTGDARHLPRDSRGDLIAIQSLSQELYADFEELRSNRARLDESIVHWAKQLTDHALELPLSYKTITGAPQSHPLWQAVGHFFNHQTHHRGQVTTLLMQAGIDPGVTDLVALLRSEAG